MRRILVIQLKRIGDLILTTPALRALRSAYPDARISLIVEEASAGLAPMIPSVDELLVFRRGGRNANLWWRLFRSGFDICLDFTGTDRSAWVSFLSRAERRLGYSCASGRGLRASVYRDLVPSSVRENHTIQHHLALLEPLGVTAEPGPPELRVLDTARLAARDLLGRSGVSGDYFVVHPGSARAEKQWLPDRWARVIESMRERTGMACVVTGSDAAEERAHVAEIIAEVHGGATPATAVADLAGFSDLPVLAALLERSRFLLTVDSAAMHLASALGLPQVALFGPTNPFHWRPLSPNAEVVQAGNPDKVFTPRGAGSPMSELQVVNVLDAAGTVLESTGVIHGY